LRERKKTHATSLSWPRGQGCSGGAWLVVWQSLSAVLPNGWPDPSYCVGNFRLAFRLKIHPITAPSHGCSTVAFAGSSSFTAAGQRRFVPNFPILPVFGHLKLNNYCPESSSLREKLRQPKGLSWPFRHNAYLLPYKFHTILKLVDTAEPKTCPAAR